MLRLSVSELSCATAPYRTLFCGGGDDDVSINLPLPQALFLFQACSTLLRWQSNPAPDWNCCGMRAIRSNQRPKPALRTVLFSIDTKCSECGRYSLRPCIRSEHGGKQPAQCRTEFCWTSPPPLWRNTINASHPVPQARNSFTIPHRDGRNCFEFVQIGDHEYSGVRPPQTWRWCTVAAST